MKLHKFIFNLLLSSWVIFSGVLAYGSGEPLAVEPGENASAFEFYGNKNQFDSLIAVSQSLLYIYPDSARQAVNQALVFKSPDDVSKQIRSLNLLGITYYIQAEHSKSLEKFLKGLTLALEIDDQKHAPDLLNNIGIVNMRSGRYMDALENFNNALAYYQQTGDRRNKSSTLNNIGMLYSEIKNYGKSREYFQEALQGFEAVEDSMGIAAALSNIGALHKEMLQADSALIYFDQAIKIQKATSNRFGLSTTCSEIASLFFSVADYDKALHYYLKSDSIAREIGYLYKHCKASLGLSLTRLEKQQTHKALEHAGKALVVANRLSNDILRQETHEVFANIYERKGNYKKGLNHYRLSMELKESLQDQGKLHQIYNLEIQELSQASEIQQLEIERQQLLISRKNSTIFFVVLAFFLAIGGAYLLVRNQKYRQLADHQKAILDLTEKKSRAAVEAEIRERKRMGQELHDGLGQMLSFARMNISMLQQKASLSAQKKGELLETALKSVDKAFYELRDISRNLAPSVLVEKGFVPALKELAEQANNSSHMQVHLEVYGLTAPLDNLVENTLYRAVQELLNNSVKHSKAKDFYLQIVKNDKEINLVAEDNGTGFDPDNTLKLPGGGLSNLRSRVENLKGELFIDSRVNRGTIVTIVIPANQSKYVKNSNSGPGRG